MKDSTYHFPMKFDLVIKTNVRFIPLTAMATKIYYTLI